MKMNIETERTIVVAWTEDTQELIPGQTWRADLGERPKFRDALTAHACMWLNSGTGHDVPKAKAYIVKEHGAVGMVFEYPTTEKDPLGRARREILARKR